MRSIERLKARISFPKQFHSDMQDWEYCVADPQRIAEFLGHYNCSALEEDDRFTLMIIILESVNDALWDGITVSEIDQISDILRRKFELHLHTMQYYAASDCDDIEQAWAIAPWMRSLLMQGRAN